MLRSLSCVLAASLLAACGSTGPVSAVTHVETQVVEKVVPVPCVDAVPQPAEAFLPVDQLLAGSGYQVVLKLDREVKKHQAYELDLVAALTGCVAGHNPAPLVAPSK